MRGSTSLFIAVACLVCMHPARAHPGHDEQPDGKALAAVQDKDALKNRVEIVIDERTAHRIIYSNGVPDHEPGRFPNRGNPNTISEQKYVYRVTTDPQVAKDTTSVYGQPFGVALNGVPFDPGTAEVWSPHGRRMRMGPPGDNDNTWNYDALSGKIDLGLDKNNAHVQPSGAYHYHGIPTGLVELLTKKNAKPTMTMVGYAADGFPIYSELAYDQPNDPTSKLRKMKPSFQLKEGNRPGGDHAPAGKYDGTFIQDFEYVKGLGDLDECNGRFGVTPEYPDGTYYYVLTESFPMIPRAFRGTPDESFSRRRGGGPGGPGNRPGREGPPGGGRDLPPPPPR